MTESLGKKTFAIDDKQADEAMSLKTWWALPFILPLSRRLVVYVVNHTRITPNQITFTAMALRLLTACFFAQDQRWGLIAGAVTYHLAFVCDCADGTIARIKKQTSELGRYLDHGADLFGDILILVVLAWTQDMLWTPMVFAMIFMYVADCYISYLSGFALSPVDGGKASIAPFNWMNRYRDWWFSRNIKSFFSFPDFNALIFVFCPLFGIPDIGLQVGFYFVLLICLYTVLSTFVSIHTGRKYFP